MGNNKYIYGPDSFQYSKQTLTVLDEEAKKEYKEGKLKPIESLKELV
jgi:hypothetical protein